MPTTFFTDPDAWSARLCAEPIPVLAETVDQLTDLALLEERSGSVDAHMIADAIGGDTLMTLRVLAHLSRHRGSQQVTDVHTVTAAVVMMGIGPFFRAFPPAGLRTVEDLLARSPEQLSAVRRLMARSWRIARVVTEFELQHGDSHAAALQVAALLGDSAEILLWCHAPDIARQLGQDPDEARQRQVLGCSMAELLQALMRHWQMPELLRTLLAPQDGLAATAPQGRLLLLRPQRRLLALAGRVVEQAGQEPPAGLTLEELEELAGWLTLSTPAAERLAQQALG